MEVLLDCAEIPEIPSGVNDLLMLMIFCCLLITIVSMVQEEKGWNGHLRGLGRSQVKAGTSWSSPWHAARPRQSTEAGRGPWVWDSLAWSNQWGCVLSSHRAGGIPLLQPICMRQGTRRQIELNGGKDWLKPWCTFLAGNPANVQSLYEVVAEWLLSKVTVWN